MWASRAAAVGLIGLSALVLGYVGARALQSGGEADVPPIELDRQTIPSRTPGVTPADGDTTVVPPPTLPGPAPAASAPPAGTDPAPPATVSPAPPAPPPATVLTPPRDDDDDDDGEDDAVGSDEGDDD